MRIIDKVLKRIEVNRTKEFNCIPFSDIFPRLSNYIPGIKKGTYYGISGAPASAKSKFTDFSFLYHPYNFSKISGINVEIVYFSFELNKEAKILDGVSRRLFDTYGIRVSPNILQSIGTHLSEETLSKVHDVSAYFAEIEDCVTFYDEPMTPSQIYRIMEDKMLSLGRVNYRMEEQKDGNIVRKVKVFDSYEPYDSEKYVIFITDHIGLMMPDKGQTLHQALATFSSNNVYFRNRYGATIVNIHQQSVDGFVEQFTLKGDNIISKVEPNLASMADNRTLSRDYDIVLGLFSPYKHEIDFYRGYKTKRFGDNCRFLSVLKNREGAPDIHIGMYFDGSVSYFEELPKFDEFSLMRSGAKVENEMLYEKYAKGLVGPLCPERQKRFNFI